MSEKLRKQVKSSNMRRANAFSQKAKSDKKQIKARSVMKGKLTAVFQAVPQGYIGFVEELPGVNTQGDTLKEARANLQEAVQLVLEANRALAEEAIGDKRVIRGDKKKVSGTITPSPSPLACNNCRLSEAPVA